MELEIRDVKLGPTRGKILLYVYPDILNMGCAFSVLLPDPKEARTSRATDIEYASFILDEVF